jgi:hypothetical protein
MTVLLLLLALTLQDLGRTLAAHPAFTARFTQTLALPSGETVEEKGTVVFAWGKGLRFDYAGREKRAYVFVPDGFYSREGGADWNFQAWEADSLEMLPFTFLLDGRVPDSVGWVLAGSGGEARVISTDPPFVLTLDRRTGWPRRLVVEQADGSRNTLAFTGHKADASRELMP